MTRASALAFIIVLALAACNASSGPESSLGQEADATAASGTSPTAGVASDDDCTELMSKARTDDRAETKADCNASRTLAEAAQNPACMTQERIDRCESKQWGARTGTIDLSPRGPPKR